MERLRFTAAAIAVVAVVCSAAHADVEHVVWNFNGSDGGEAPSSITSEDGGYELSLVSRTFTHPGEFDKQRTQSDSPGTLLYWHSGDTADSFDAAGSIQMYRWDYTNSVKAMRYPAAYNMTNAATKELFPTNSAGDLLPFTLEIVFKAQPYDEATTAGAAKNFFLVALSRLLSGANTVFRICAISNGNLYMQCETVGGSNGDVYNGSILDGSKFRDGRWHHLALVYSLDTEVTPHQGTVKVYLDYSFENTYVISKHSDVKCFRYRESNKENERDAYFCIGTYANNYGADLSIDSVRVSGGELKTGQFMRFSNSADAISERVAGTVARWKFDAPGCSGQNVGTAEGTVPAADGIKSHAMRGGVYNGSAWASAWDDTGDFLPMYTNEIPHAIVWDPGTGRILNSKNATSIFFKHPSEQGAKTQADCGGSSVRSGTIDLDEGGKAHSNFTFECFFKCDKTFNGNVSGLFGFFNPVNSDKYAVLDIVNGKNPRLTYRVPGNSYQNLAPGKNKADGNWHHAAANYDLSSGTSTIVRLWLDYEQSWTNETLDAISFPAVFAAVCGDMPQDKPFSGLIDEPRVMEGPADPSRFMRAFEQRADMTGVWLVAETLSLTGAEWFSPDTAWLTGRWKEGEVEPSGELPASETVVSLGGRKVRLGGSASFLGGWGFTIPCAAIVGTNVFTVEANVCGRGSVFAKKRYVPTASWEVVAPSDGVYMEIGGARTASEVSINDGKWHHVALVVDGAQSGTASLYVDGTLAAQSSVAGMVLDEGDLVVGEGFEGNIAAVRFSPGLVEPDRFLVAGAPKGLLIMMK